MPQATEACDLAVSFLVFNHGNGKTHCWKVERVTKSHQHHKPTKIGGLSENRVPLNLKPTG